MCTKKLVLMLCVGVAFGNMQAIWRTAAVSAIIASGLAHENVVLPVIDVAESDICGQRSFVEMLDAQRAEVSTESSIQSCDYEGNVIHACLKVANSCWELWSSEAEALDSLRCALAKGNDVDATDMWGYSGLYVLGSQFNKNVDWEKSGRCETLSTAVQLLVQAGAHTKAVQFTGNKNLLHLATESGYSDILFDLVTAGVDINQADAYGDTPLHSATRYGCAYEHKDEPGVCASMSTLLELRADPNRKNNVGHAPLHLAGSQKTAQLLVEHKADIEAVESYNGDTPLLYAARRSRYGQVAVLLVYGAHTKACDSEGRTALEIAQHELSLTPWSANDAKTVALLQEL